MSIYGVFSGPYFPVFGLNTGKYGPDETPHLSTFHSALFTLTCLYLFTFTIHTYVSLYGFLEEELKTSMYVNFGHLYTFADQIENCSIQIYKVKDWTFRFQITKCTCLIMTSNAKNNRKNGRSKFLEKLKEAIPAKSDKSCGMMGQKQKNSGLRYFSCCVNVTRFLSIISLNLTKVWL